MVDPPPLLVNCHLHARPHPASRLPQSAAVCEEVGLVVLLAGVHLHSCMPYRSCSPCGSSNQIYQDLELYCTAGGARGHAQLPRQCLLQGMMMILQNHYQRRRMYTRIALGKNRAMDVVSGESSGGTGQLVVLYPLLFRPAGLPMPHRCSPND